MSLKAMYSEYQAAQEEACMNHTSEWSAGMEDLKGDDLLELEISHLVGSMESLSTGVESVNNNGGVSALSSRMISRGLNTVNRRLTGESNAVASMEGYADAYGELTVSTEAWADVKKKLVEAWDIVLKQIVRFYEIVKGMIDSLLRGKVYVDRKLQGLKEASRLVKDTVIADNTLVTLSSEALNHLSLNGSVVKPNELTRKYKELTSEVTSYGKQLIRFSDDLCTYVSGQAVKMRKGDDIEAHIADQQFRFENHREVLNYKGSVLLGDVSFKAPVATPLNTEDKEGTAQQFQAASFERAAGLIGLREVEMLKVSEVTQLLTAIEDFTKGRDALEKQLKAGSEERVKSAKEWDRVMRASSEKLSDKVRFTLPYTRFLYKVIRTNQLRAVLQSLTFAHTTTIHALTYADRSLAKYRHK